MSCWCKKRVNVQAQQQQGRERGSHGECSVGPASQNAERVGCSLQRPGRPVLSSPKQTKNPEQHKNNQQKAGNKQCPLAALSKELYGNLLVHVKTTARPGHECSAPNHLVKNP